MKPNSQFTQQGEPRVQEPRFSRLFIGYLILAQRYKELFNGGESGFSPDVPYEIDGHLTEIDTEKIDSDYMNSRFTKYLKAL